MEEEMASPPRQSKFLCQVVKWTCLHLEEEGLPWSLGSVVLELELDATYGLKYGHLTQSVRKRICFFLKLSIGIFADEGRLAHGS